MGEALHTIGLGFLADPNYGIPLAMISVVIAATWQMSGFVMVLYLAAARNPRGAEGSGPHGRRQRDADAAPRLAAAAAAGDPQRDDHPGPPVAEDIRPRRLDDRRGPGFATDVPALFMFETTFRGNHFARGAAISIVMLVTVSVLIIPYLYWSLRREARL